MEDWEEFRSKTEFVAPNFVTIERFASTATVLCGTMRSWSVFSALGSAAFNGRRSTNAQRGVRLEISLLDTRVVPRPGEIVVDRSVNRAARHRSILNRPWNNLICLLLWECYVRIGGRFLSSCPGCLLNSRSNKLDPIDFWISLFESDPPLDSSFHFSLPLLRIKRGFRFSPRLAGSWKGDWTIFRG